MFSFDFLSFQLSAGIKFRYLPAHTKKLYVLFNFQFLDPHLVTTTHLQLIATAIRTGLIACSYLDRFTALHAPGYPRQMDDLQLRTISEATPHHRIETETHRFGLYPRQCPDLQPDPPDPAIPLTDGLLFQHL
jgi:hypothetical protein